MFNNVLHPWHIIVLVIVVVLLFGYKKLPDAARGLGRSMRIFKSEIKEMQNDGKSDTESDAEPARELPAGSAPTGTDSANVTKADVKKSA